MGVYSTPVSPIPQSSFEVEWNKILVKMGNSTSTVTNSGAPPEDVEGSGVFLSKEYQDELFQDFQSKVLKEQWEKHQKYLIAKTNDRRLADFETKEALKEKLGQFRQQNSLVHNQLDQQADSLQARFSDLSTEIKFDTDRMDRTYLNKSAQGQKASSCLKERSNITLCFKDDPSKCDAIISVLEKCINDAITQQ